MTQFVNQITDQLFHDNYSRHQPQDLVQQYDRPAVGTTGHCSFIPETHVRIIYEGLKAGKGHITASPCYPITRDEAAYILNNYQVEL